MLRTRKASRFFLAALYSTLLTLAIPGQAVLAKPPAGKGQAENNVCDTLIGGTPGLYGLCLAYCEAQVCDAKSAHSGKCTRKPPNERALKNYTRKMRAGDSPMPCLAPPPSPCPCLTEEEAGYTHWVSCSTDENDRLRVDGLQGELFLLDRSGSTCDASGMPGITDRYSSLDEQQLEACRSLAEMGTDYDGVSCQNEPPPDDNE